MAVTVDVIGLGELLWDCFPDQRRPGGAPANVAYHAQQLGLSAAVLTRVGTDSLGDELITFLNQQGLSTQLVQRDPVHGTGTVTVVPRGTSTDYQFLPDSAWDFLEADTAALAAVRGVKALCFGTLAQRSPVSRENIQRLVAATPAACLRVYDVNLRPPFYEQAWIEESLRLANIVKLNDDEVRTLAQLLGGPVGELAFAQFLLREYSLQLVCITKGAHGALAVSSDATAESEGFAVEVADTVGAGDAFTATLIWSQLQRWPLQQGVELANRVGALVASRAGAMPDIRSELQPLLAGYR